MSRTDESIEERRNRTSPSVRQAVGMLRRMTITVTSGAFWQVVGHLLLDGVTAEAPDAEVFSGIGFFSRPKAGTNRESIVAYIGGAENPVIIATRDEDTRKRVAQIDEDETAMFNTQAGVFVQNNSTVEVRTVAGVPLKLPTMADFENLRAFVAAQFAAASGHIHATPSGATTTIALAAAAPTLPAVGTGTLCLKTM